MVFERLSGNRSSLKSIVIVRTLGPEENFFSDGLYMLYENFSGFGTSREVTAAFEYTDVSAVKSIAVIFDLGNSCRYVPSYEQRSTNGPESFLSVSCTSVRSKGLTISICFPGTVLRQ